MFYTSILTLALFELIVIGKAFGAKEPTPRCRGTTGCVNDVMSLCLCDIQDETCDVNCCCDSDCSSEDKMAFSECLDTALSTATSACIRQDFLFRDNSPYVVNVTIDGLFCVYRDNSQQMNRLATVNTVRSITEFNILRDSNGQTKYSYNEQNEQEQKDSLFKSYKSGDPILVLYAEDTTLGYLPFPSASMTSNTCVDTNPAAYLLSEMSTCVRRLHNLSNQCQSDAMLRASTFYGEFVVLRNADILSPMWTITHRESTGPETHSLRDLLGSSDVVPVKVAVSESKCLDARDVPVPCTSDTGQFLEPTWDENTKLCSNAVRKLSTITMGGDMSPTQTFQKIFFKAANASASMPSVVSRYSGNPGYNVGLPMRAGKLLTGEDLTTRILRLMTDDGRDMTTLSSDVDGWCTDNVKRVPITFGINMYSGCFIRLTEDEVTSTLCNTTQWTTYVALRGPDPATHVATFGNSNQDVVADWIEIFGVAQHFPEARGSVHSSLACHNMLVGLDVEIAYANVGSFDNPQAQIVGARYNYFFKNELQIACQGPSCNSRIAGIMQRHLVTSSVTFIDVTTPPVVISRH